MKAKSKIHNILFKYWGYSSFKDKQEEIIHAVLNKKDTLALLPTGGGKSLCYQVPAMLNEGVCIVISPLIALMKDQVDQLHNKNIKAIAIYSGMNHREIDIALDNCIYGKVKFLYISPERLESDFVRARIEKMNVNLFAIDEAHCISQWGYDFRPSYLKIADIRDLKPKTPVLALTATATKDVVADIQEKLNFSKRNEIRTSFVRKNLAYMVLEENQKMSRIKKMLIKTKGSSIIYVRSRNKAEDISKELNDFGVNSQYYHAGLLPSERDERQKKWMNNHHRVMVATNAFGMGIDKPDVRLVIHVQLPNTIEAYFQEAGRAGRDGKKSFAVSLYQKSELEYNYDKFKDSYPTINELRALYQNIADYLQIAIGDGYLNSFEFNLKDFCATYKLNENKCLKSFQILENHSLLKYENTYKQNSRIKITCSTSIITNYKSPNSKKNEFLQTILRIYPGVFDEEIEINERKIAQKLNCTSTYIYKLLNQFNDEQILSYKKRIKNDVLTLITARYPQEHLPISKTQFNKRKSQLKNKLKSINEYLIEDTFCRSKLLLDYFDEKQNQDCGVCDVCIKIQIDGSDFKLNVKNKLFSILKHNSVDIFTFVNRYSKLKEAAVLDIIEELIKENIIIKEGKTLRFNEKQ